MHVHPILHRVSASRRGVTPNDLDTGKEESSFSLRDLTLRVESFWVTMDDGQVQCTFLFVQSVSVFIALTRREHAPQAHFYSLLSLTVLCRRSSKPPLFMPIDENLELATSSHFLHDSDSAFGGRSHYRSNSVRKRRRGERAASETREPERSAEWTSDDRSSRAPMRDSLSNRSVGRRVRSYSAASAGPLESTARLGSLRAEQN